MSEVCTHLEHLAWHLRPAKRRLLRIPKTEERGITLRQLRAVWCDVRRFHAAWVDWHGDLLSCCDTEINLYHVNGNLICPRTKPLRCSYVELISKDPATQMPRWFVSHW